MSPYLTRVLFFVVLPFGLAGGPPTHVPLPTWEKGHDEETACRLRLGDTGVDVYSRWSETDDKNPDVRWCFVKPGPGSTWGTERRATVVISRDYAPIGDTKKVTDAIQLGKTPIAGGQPADDNGAPPKRESATEPVNDPICIGFPDNAFKKDLKAAYRAKPTKDGGHKKGLQPQYQNVAILWWKDADGEHHSEFFTSGPEDGPTTGKKKASKKKSIHSEEYMAKFVEEIKQDGGKVTAIYSELSPCPYCKADFIPGIQDGNGHPPVMYGWKWRPGGEHLNCGNQPAKQERWDKKREFSEQLRKELVDAAKARLTGGLP